MTCEIALLNRNAVALAADRAVTVGDGKKIFTDADKIFQLHPETPVAVMIYGCAEMMGVPWRVIVNSYASALGSRKFDTLREYAQDFLKEPLNKLVFECFAGVSGDFGDLSVQPLD